MERLKVFTLLLKSVRLKLLFPSLPYPIDSRTLSALQHERNEIDQIFSSELARKFDHLDSNELLNNVHSALDEWLIARQP